MRRPEGAACALVSLILALACGGAPDVGPLPGEPSYPVRTPPEATVDVSLPTLAALTQEQAALWERHLRASLGWEIRLERGCTYAVALKPDARGRYVSTLNGFHRGPGGSELVQARVVMGLGCSHGFGRDRGQIVHASADAGSVQLVLEDYMDQPGDDSALLITGGAGHTLEIFEQSHDDHRTFTADTLARIEAELAGVLAASDELVSSGLVSALVPEGSVERGGVDRLEIHDGMQPGIYLVEGWVNPAAAGLVQLRVFVEGPEPGQSLPADVPEPGTELSAERLRPRSQRKIGYGPDPDVRFRYQSEITVYEGDWGQPYRARFELWHLDGDTERRLTQASRRIEGWMR